MAYIYPKFSKYELPGIRLGGAGLGNLLFTWSRAIAAARQYHAKLIWPTWPSIKIGPWIRRERDKRFYGDLFSNRSAMCDGIRKYIRLMFGKKIHTRDLKSEHWNHLRENDIVVYDDYYQGPGSFQMNFRGLENYREQVVETILENVGKKGKAAIAFDASKAINVHVRLGDFAQDVSALSAGKNNTRIPIKWYVGMIVRLRQTAGWNVPVNLFSDGTDAELDQLLKLPVVRRVTFGNSIGDIIALSRAPIMIASGSSFSLWARYLGNCSSISYPAQMKDRVHIGDNGFEVELGENDVLSSEIRLYIQEVYRDD